MITLECLLELETKKDINTILGGLGFKESLPKNYKELLNDKDFLLFSEASIENKIAKLKKEIKEEKNEYKKTN